MVVEAYPDIRRKSRHQNYGATDACTKLKLGSAMWGNSYYNLTAIPLDWARHNYSVSDAHAA